MLKELRNKGAADSPASSTVTSSVFDTFFNCDTALLLVFVALCNLKGSFFIATFDEQVRHLDASDQQKASLLSCWYLALPLGGMLMSIISPLVLSMAGERTSWYFLVCLLLVTIQALSNLVLTLPAQYLAALVLGPSRTLLWACYFHFVGTTYPPEVVGRTLGYGNLPIALVSDLSPIFVQSAVNAGDAENPFFAMNSGSTFLLLCCLALPVRLMTKEAGKQQADLPSANQLT